MSFAGSPAVPPATIPLDLNIPNHSTMGWNFAKSNDIVTPFRAPGQISFSDGWEKLVKPELLAQGIPLPDTRPTPPANSSIPAVRQ
jgi:hypothetical protein